MFVSRILRCWLWLTLCVSCGTLSARGVIISLAQEDVGVDQKTVRIGDVARVVGVSGNELEYITELDLETLSEKDSCKISKQQITMRLLLAGFERDSFEVTGPGDVTAWRSSPTQMRGHIATLMANKLSEQFGMDSGRVSVRLTNAEQLKSIEATFPNPTFDLEILPPNEFPIGKQRLSVDLIDADGRRTGVILECQVSISMPVPIAVGPIARGSVIQPNMIRIVEREIVARADYASTDAIVGRTANRYISGNSIVLANHLIPTRRGTNDLVKRNDLVDVVVKIGNGEIRLKNAQALESGKMGDTIEVLNPQSGRRINASIIGPNLATTARVDSRRY